MLCQLTAHLSITVALATRPVMKSAVGWSGAAPDCADAPYEWGRSPHRALRAEGPRGVPDEPVDGQPAWATADYNGAGFRRGPVYSQKRGCCARRSHAFTTPFQARSARMSCQPST